MRVLDVIMVGIRISLLQCSCSLDVNEKPGFSGARKELRVRASFGVYSLFVSDS